MVWLYPSDPWMMSGSPSSWSSGSVVLKLTWIFTVWPGAVFSTGISTGDEELTVTVVTPLGVIRSSNWSMRSRRRLLARDGWVRKVVRYHLVNEKGA